MTIDQEQKELKPLSFKGTDSLENFPNLIVGAGVFNYQYHENPHTLPAEDVLKRAFDLGLRALDTSAYYGPSEEIVGAALKKISPEYTREDFFICTKAGRFGVDKFDYSRDAIIDSFERSLKRLHTTYIDVLYIHDVEFVDYEGCLEAVRTAFQLKSLGLVRWVGISGYPVEFLLKLAVKVKNELGQPLDVILSYCNYCLQNTKLSDYDDRFRNEAGVSKIMNASPLSMSLLRSQPTHSFHPASENLKAKVQQVSDYFWDEHHVDLADLASRFVFRTWNGSTVFGLQTVQEVERAVNDYWVASTDDELKQQDEKMFKQAQEMLGECLNETWPSGISHD